MHDLFAHIDAHQKRYLERLFAMLRQPSVAAQDWGIAEMAQQVADLLDQLGAQVEVIPTDGHPVVVGQFKGASEKTLSFYNHYDVQPPEPLELWDSDPWKPEVREGKLYARGVADNKGNLAARLAALESTLAVTGGLPCGIKFIVEGEEEIGSPNLDAFAKAHRDLVMADGCVWEFGGKDVQERQVMTFGVKGICYVELSVNVAARDYHSAWAAVLPNAAWRLVWALRSLKGPDERVQIRGFYDAVRAPDEQDLQALADLDFDEAGYKESFGVQNYVNDLTGMALLKKLYFEPTCTVCGLDSGYTGRGSKTVSPHLAKAKVDFRLVPDQDPEHIVDLLRQHLDENGFSDVEVTQLGGEPAGRTALDAPLGQLMLETAKRVYEKPPVLHPLSPGSGPWHQLCGQFGIPTVSTGCGYEGSQVHAPNENVRLDDFWLHAKHMALLIEGFADAAHLTR